MVVFLGIEILGLVQRVALVTDVFQVVVELHLAGEGEADGDDDAQSDDDKRVTVVCVVVYPFYSLEYLLVVPPLVLPQEMRQENQHEEGVADEREGGEHTELLEQVALGEEESDEGPDGGEAAEADGQGLFLQHLLHVAHKALMDNDMQAVTERDAQHHGADAEGHQRHTALNPVHARQREKGAVGHGQHVLPGDIEALEAETEDNQDNQQRDADCEVDVARHDAVVVARAHHAAVHQHFDVGVRFLEFTDTVVDMVHQLAAQFSVERLEIRGDVDECHRAVGAEEVSVDESETQTGGEVGHQVLAEVERVGGHHIGDGAGLVVHDQLVVVGHRLVGVGDGRVELGVH